jgi:hypothetical protein
MVFYDFYPDRAQHVLKYLGIVSIDQFIHMDLQNAIWPKNVNPQTRRFIFRAQKNCKNRAEESIKEPKNSRLQRNTGSVVESTITDDFAGLKGWEKDILKVLGVKSITDFVDLDISKASTFKSVGKKKYAVLLMRQKSLKRALYPIQHENSDFVGYSGREQNALRLLGVKSNMEFVDLDISSSLFKKKGIGQGTYNKLLRRRRALKRTLYPLLDSDDFVEYSKCEQDALSQLSVKSNKEFMELDFSKVSTLKGINKKTYNGLLRRQLALKQTLDPLFVALTGAVKVFNLEYLLTCDFSERTSPFKPWTFFSGASRVPALGWLAQITVDYPRESILGKSLQTLFPQFCQDDDFLTEKRIADVLPNEIKNEWDLTPGVQIRTDDFLECVFSTSLFILLRDIPSTRLLSALLEALNVDTNFRDSLADKVSEFSVPNNFMDWLKLNTSCAVVLASDVNFDCSLFPQSVACILRNQGITKIPDLAEISESLILLKNGFNSNSLVEIVALWAIMTLLQAVNRTLCKYDFPGNYTKTADMVTSVFMHDRMQHPPKDQVIDSVCLRYAGKWDQKDMTLKNIGKAVSVTRERVRQVLSDHLPKLDGSIAKGKLPRLRNIINNQLWLNGGALSLDELAQKCRNVLGLQGAFGGKMLGYMLQGTPEIEIDSENGIAILLIHPCAYCPELHRRLHQIPPVSAEGSIGSLTKTQYNSCPESCPMKSCSVVFHPLWFTKCLLIEGWLKNKGLRLHNDRIISEKEFTIYFSSTEDAVHQILQSAKKPLHFTEVYQQLKDLWNSLNIPPRSSEARVHIILIGSEDCLLWGRGTFIHVENVKVSQYKISHVIHYLKKELGKRRPFITAYELYEVYCSKKQSDLLPNEQALYEILRIQAGDMFRLQKFPYIYKKNAKIILTVTDLVEEYVLSSSKGVTYAELEGYISEVLHFKYSYSIIEGTPNLLRIDRGLLTHKDNLELHSKRFHEIIDFVANIVKTHNHVSAELVFDERSATCREAGIASPIMLHSVIELIGDDRINTLRYPLLAKPNDEESQKNLTMYQTIIDYINCQGRPVSLEELEQRFVEDRGYTEITLHNTLSGRATRMGIRRYAKSVYIAEKTLRWSDKKLTILCNLANNEYSLATKAGYHFAHIDNVLEREGLPDLKEGIYWTPDLFADLLEASEKYIVLGNKRRAYVPIKNVDAISNFSDLVYLLMKEHFGNSVRLDKLSEYLKQNDLVEKCLIPFMFIGTKKLQIRDGVVITQELAHYVA